MYTIDFGGRNYMQKKIKKAVIPAAGLGTRFLPATKAQPKEMLPIVDKPTLQYIIEEAVASGIEEILIITGKNKKTKLRNEKSKRRLSGVGLSVIIMWKIEIYTWLTE